MADRLDINTATLGELAKLPGVGETIADSIVTYRSAHGSFEIVDALLKVSGVTERLLERIRPLITITSAPGRPADAENLEIELTHADNRGEFAGHTVTVQGVRAAGIEDVPDVPFIASAPTTPDGVAKVSIPARAALVGDVTLEARAPDGESLKADTRDGPTLPQKVTMTVQAAQSGTTQPNTDPAAGKPTRLRGQVIDSAGRRLAASLQVVLWAADAETPQAVDFRALTVSTADGQGHFVTSYPLGTFTAAHATVGLPAGPMQVPIHLDDTGQFPETVLLVLDLPDPVAVDDDCGCKADSSAPRSPDATDLARADGTFSADAGAGRCVDFTKPDRTLEEYSFSYLVRTTEPDIRGLTLDEPAKVSVAKLAPYVNAEIARRTANPGAGATLALAAGLTADAVDDDELTGQIDAGALRSLARYPAAPTLKALLAAVKLTRHSDLQRFLGTAVAKAPGRVRLDGANPVDWDDDPTVYQATSIAHGHILRIKQEWVADGYSMGNLLYSLPLAPGQKKQIAVVDWERREATARDEFRESRDSLQASIARDRDVAEVVSGTLNETMRGGSHASSGSIAAGLGVGVVLGPVGALLGVGGGHSSADSSAWQSSSRTTSANALNQLRDRTIQSASSVRTQRTSVVQSVAQGERVVATTESVANYNHCHALTIQYFEVLRHLLVRQRVVDVQECLLVPLLMSWFTGDKALRWRNTLASAVPSALRPGFDALDRIDAGYVGSDLPVGRYADENLDTVEGELNIRFQLARPRDVDDDFDPAAWNPLLGLFGFTPKDFYDQYLRDQKLKDRVFLEQLGPRIANTVVQFLRVNAVKTDESTVDLRIDPTLVTQFANDRTLFVSLRMAASLSPVHRADIKAVVISSRLAIPGMPFVVDLLPAGSRVIVESGSLRYRTAHLSSSLFTNSFIRNDLTGYDDVRIETPLNRQELRNPREEDKELARNLLDHLNENIERYHHILWSRMSDHRRFMLLDGFEAPNSAGRSVASVVENELIGIVGNSLVLPVARGFHLDPTYRQDTENPIDLLEHYQPNTPIEPSRIALPTSGVYAEAVMGACNSCEVIDETRFWRWEEAPIPDSPPQILPSSTDTRRATPADVAPTAFPQPIIAMQNAPAAPDPTGVGAALNLLGQAGSFRDVAGLEGTQRNAAAALEQAFNTATTFGTKAADLALQGKMSKDIDKAMKTIQSAKAQGLIDDKAAAELTATAIRGMVGGGTTNPAQATTTDEVKKLTETAGANAASVKVTRPTGEKVEVDARSQDAEDATSRPVIILSNDTSSADTRSFRPSTQNKTGIIDVDASFRNAPSGSSLRWSSPGGGALTIDNPSSARTRVRGVTPGRHDLDVDLLDGGGSRIASMKLQLSVPQCVKIVEDAVQFDAALSAAHLTGSKDEIIAEAKRTVEAVLAKSNVRVYWQLGGFNELIPGHVPVANVMVATIRNVGGGPVVAGVTHGPGGVGQFNETIEVFPGVYDDTNATDVDTETQALILQLESSLATDPALVAVAAKVYGRLIGETLAHEIVHGLLWTTIDASAHNNPDIAGDLMNNGVSRSFAQRTGMENTAQTSPVLPSHFVDHGVGAVNSLQATNQALMDTNFPVPPALL